MPLANLRLHLLAALATAGLAACTATVDDGGGLAPDGATGGSSTPTGPSCTTDADCADGGRCVDVTQDPEFPTRVCMGGDGGGGGGGGSSTGCDPTIDPTCTVDATCGTTGSASMDYYPPFVPLVPPQVPATCANGFEINNSYPLVYTIDSKTAAGSRAITLDLDIATYTASNWITIRGVDANGQTYVLLDTCRMKTWDQADPTSPRGHTRPLDETIRQFRVDVRPGTTQLSFDFSKMECSTPFYVKAVGLCDFDIATNPWAGNLQKQNFWRPI